MQRSETTVGSFRQRVLAALLALVAVVMGTEAALSDKSKVTMILATGGTIAGKQSDPFKPGYTSGQAVVADLIAAVPELKDVATIEGKNISDVSSQNMDATIWLKLLRATTEELARADVDGGVMAGRN